MEGEEDDEEDEEVSDSQPQAKKKSGKMLNVESMRHSRVSRWGVFGSGAAI